MSQRAFPFVVVLLLIFNGEIFGQFKAGSGQINLKPSLPSSLPTYPAGRIAVKDQPLISLYQKYNYTYLPILPSSYSVTTGSFFCKKEYQLEQLTNIPFRFRLGSLEYV